ncbi:MAG: cell division FtsA domain-containing protein [Vicinamibacteria bacterium]|nr:cell division FtsA domain-containing protein [Vicinamibacteria bacterium]
MEERKDHLWKVALDAEERIEDLVKTATSPVGVDVGTSKIVVALRRTKDVDTSAQINAFIPVPYSRFTESTLTQNAIAHYREDDDLIVYGTAAERFANLFNAETRRPMADGMVNPKEKLAMPVLEAILGGLVPKPRTQGEIMAFSVPAGEDREAALTYHEAMLRQYFESLGYTARPINEGVAVIFSELEDHNFTGIGISCGGGMTNVTLAHLSIPFIMFAIPKAGDYIDHSVGMVVNEHATRVKIVKEENLDLSRPPRDKFDRALHIYYQDLVETLVETLRQRIVKSERKSERPMPIVLSGGTSRPRGFKDLFEKTLNTRPLPMPISEVRLARDPLTATARGALIAAMYER